MEIKQHGFIIDDVVELAQSYNLMKSTVAFKDLELHLNQIKQKAMSILKLKEDPEARAMWQLVDKIFNRLEYVEKEAKIKNNIDGKNK